MSGLLISINRAGLIAAGATDAEANRILLSVPDPTNPDMVLDAYRKFLDRRPLLKLWRAAKRRFGRRWV